MTQPAISKGFPALLAASQQTESPIMAAVFTRCTPEEQREILLALKSAYEAGQDAADQRSGKLMARIFGGFVGVTPGIDLDESEESVSPRKRLVGLVRLLASAGGQR